MSTYSKEAALTTIRMISTDSFYLLQLPFRVWALAPVRHEECENVFIWPGVLTKGSSLEGLLGGASSAAHYSCSEIHSSASGGLMGPGIVRGYVAKMEMNKVCKALSSQSLSANEGLKDKSL
jgi:hypothetical protein